MKRLLFTWIALFALCGGASAQRLQAGFRGGLNTTDFRFSPVTIDGTCFTTGTSHAGYEAGFVLRLNLSKYIHLQSELNYDFVNYGIHASKERLQTDIRLRSERLELPVQLGFQFGFVRLFGGVSFRLRSSLHSSHPDRLRIAFGSNKPALMGGLGLNIRHFFLDFRIQGYAGPKHHNTFIANGVQQKVHMHNDIVWGGSCGFFF